MLRYYRLVKNKTITTMLPITESPYSVVEKDISAEYYTSCFTYSEDQYKIFQKTKSCKGFDNGLSKKIWFDLDSKEDLSIAHEDTKTLVNILKTHWIEPRICFSGSKGFSVDFALDDYWNVEEIRTFAIGIAGHLDTLDCDTLYQNQTLFRLPLTKNPKSGGSKIPLTIEQLTTLSIDDIKSLSLCYKYNASDIQNKLKTKIHTLDKQYFMNEYKNKVPLQFKRRADKMVQKMVVENSNIDYSNIDFTQNREGFPANKFVLEKGYFGSGNRDMALMILGATYKAQGYDKEMVYRMLKGVAQNQANLFECDRFPDTEIYNNIIETIFSSGWRGGYYSSENTPLLAMIDNKLPPQLRHKASLVDETLCTIEDDDMEFENYINNYDKNTIKTGIPGVDENVQIGIGMSVGIVGAPSSGKTSCLIDILGNISESGQKALFVSLDMSRAQVYSKKLSRETGKGFKALRFMRDNHPEDYIKARLEMKKKWKNIITTYKPGISVTEIKAILDNYNSKHAEKIKVVCIDYLECLSSTNADALVSQTNNVFALRELANSGYCVITLLQPNKMGGNPSKPLLDYNSIKGSGTIAQSMRLILSIYREGFNPQGNKDKFLTISAIKNNLGPLFSVDMHWDAVRGRISELTPEGRKELEQLRETLKVKNEDY